MKLGKSCVQCRTGKRKCTRGGLEGACVSCIRRQISCSHTDRGRPPRCEVLLPATSSSDAPDISDLTPSSEIKHDLVGLYIRHIHNKPHSIFHEPSLRRSVSNGSISSILLFAIFGLTARFSSDSKIRSRGNDYFLEAKRLLKEDLENICITNIQVCILIANTCGANTEAMSEALYFGIANRMAQLLTLEKTDHEDDSITAEMKRRIWWTLYLIDRWSSAGLGLTRQIHISGDRPQLPMHELDFFRLIPGQEYDRSLRRRGCWAHMITLVQIFGRIQDLNKAIIDPSISDGEVTTIATTAESLAIQLENFEQDLEPEFRYSAQNLIEHHSQGLGATFVALHLGYHHYATLLYYQFLNRKLVPSPRVKQFAERCKYHAAAYSDLITLSKQFEGSEPVYNIVGHMTVVSSSVLLHTLLFSSEEELPAARRRLESNFEWLVKLREYWPSVGLMTSRLITFQNLCLESETFDNYSMDNWMVKFLLQHALDVEYHPKSHQTSAAFPGAGEDHSPEVVRLLERSRVTQSIIGDY